VLFRSFPIVADPERQVVRLFGPWERLPQVYLVAADGTVVHHAEGFEAAEAAVLTAKVEKSFVVAGRPLPEARAGEAGPALPAADEAPSIRDRREKEDRYRSNVVQGTSAYMAWEFDKALLFFLEALKDQPNDVGTLVRVAQIYERRGDPDNALVYWERVLGVRADHPEALAHVKALRPAPARGPGD
jgi:tetratricopeptide (TPR) repeat protein